MGFKTIKMVVGLPSGELGLFPSIFFTRPTVQYEYSYEYQL